MFGPCKICIEKEKRIEELKEEVEFLRAMLLPNSNGKIVNLEANNILSGSQAMIDIPEYGNDKIREQEEINREAERIMNGTY